MPVSKRDENLAVRRRQLTYRANHRGIREMDILIGGFAERNLARFSAAELDRFEALLAEPDHDLLAWFTGQGKVPRHVDEGLLAAIREDAARISK